MTVLGIDPGTLVTGYGVVETTRGRDRLVACGCVVNRGEDGMPERLGRIYEALTGVIERCRPAVCAVETAFYGRNAQSALKLGHARGVALLAAVVHNLPAFEYSPREVKRAIAGTGGASKEQVRDMVRTILRLREAPGPFDVTDAIAVAICHSHRNAAVAAAATAAGSSGRRAKPRAGKADWKRFVEHFPERVAR